MVFENKTNKDQKILKELTKKLVTSDDNLWDFGLHLDFTYEQIEQKRNNNPRCVELAAFTLACHWWNYEIYSDYKKRTKLLEFCKVVKKLHLKSEIKELLEINPRNEEQEVWV